MTMMRDYQSAITLLNSLQTNHQILEKIRKTGNLLNQKAIPEMKQYLHRIGYDPQDLNQLNVIHIAGTKGKGSTAAFCQSILRRVMRMENGNERQLKTGLYTSPHLLEVRERIRINGIPLSHSLFAQHFFEVWDRLEETKRDDKPSYFRFLTLMAYHVFIVEKVDVAIFEVGVGGEYDSTNLFPAPSVCGITSLGLDHTALLGDSIDKIAWHKAGIMKLNRPCYSVPQHPDALAVLKSRAVERSCELILLSNSNSVKNINLGISGAHQEMNAELSSQICQKWVEIHRKSMKLRPLSDFIESGLVSTKWPGRCMRFESESFPNIDWCLDGAHTTESLSVIIFKKLKLGLC